MTSSEPERAGNRMMEVFRQFKNARICIKAPTMPSWIELLKLLKEWRPHQVTRQMFTTSLHVKKVNGHDLHF